MSTFFSTPTNHRTLCLRQEPQTQSNERKLGTGGPTGLSGTVLGSCLGCALSRWYTSPLQTSVFFSVRREQ